MEARDLNRYEVGTEHLLLGLLREQRGVAAKVLKALGLELGEAREEIHDLFAHRWVPSGVVLPEEGLTDAEVVATIIRITGGNFRLLHRLLTQIARVAEINALSQVTREVVEAARESLVIGAV